MKQVVLAAKGWAVSTWLATGVKPVASPPLTPSRLPAGLLDGADLLYVCMHGFQGQPFWYGQALGGPITTAVTADQVRASDLQGCIAYLAGCWGAGPMVDALQDAGAAAVVGDTDVNWAGLFWPAGSNLLGKLFLQHLRLGQDVGRSLAHAKAALSGRGDRYNELTRTVQLWGDPAAVLKG